MRPQSPRPVAAGSGHANAAPSSSSSAHPHATPRRQRGPRPACAPTGPSAGSCETVTMPFAPPVPASLPASVEVGLGSGGLPVVRVAGRQGSAEIYLHGAQVTAWTPAGGRPVLWLSATSRFLPDAAIRGGVPICFPWFGAKAGAPSAAAHGFARLTEWEFVDAQEAGDDVVLTFRLGDTPATRASAWPHRFEALYTVTVGTRLALALRITNLEPEAVTFEEALHTYLRVDDVRDVRVAGLEGAPFLDQLAGLTEAPGASEPVRFEAETDRIYLGTDAAATVIDPAGHSVTIEKRESHSTVVWNPWAAKARSMSDFGDEEWTGMVCVETANIRGDLVRLEPGQSHTMTAVLAAVA
ncbi:D-hexose-6-phosphate mutarotase [Cryobacterium sp. TMT1-21]|nr:D-hexose-6-phosphate mutarotase [Cryobacterium sp. TMT1-21]